MSYYVHESAIKELQEYQKTLLSAVGYHLISAEKAKKQYWERLRSVIAAAYVHTDEPSRNVPVQCPGCDRILVVPSDLRSFECRCSPGDVRFVASCRNIGRERTEDLLRRVKRPQTTIVPAESVDEFTDCPRR